MIAPFNCNYSYNEITRLLPDEFKLSFGVNKDHQYFCRRESPTSNTYMAASVQTFERDGWRGASPVNISDLAYWLFGGDYINDMNFNDYMDSTTVNVAAVSMLDMSELL